MERLGKTGSDIAHDRAQVECRVRPPHLGNLDSGGGQGVLESAHGLLALFKPLGLFTLAAKLLGTLAIGLANCFAGWIGLSGTVSRLAFFSDGLRFVARGSGGVF